MKSRTLLLASTDLRVQTAKRDLLLIIGFSIALSAAAQVRLPLPWTPVPVTAQTLVVGLAGILLGARRGFLAVLFYLCEGAMGLPVFSGGAAGPAALLGPTAGYLAAMPFAAGLVGYLAERGWDRSSRGAFAAMLACTLLILAGGTLCLAGMTGSLSSAITLGFLPFVAGEVAKAVLAAAILPSLWMLRRRDIV